MCMRYDTERPGVKIGGLERVVMQDRGLGDF